MKNLLTTLLSLSLALAVFGQNANLAGGMPATPRKQDQKKETPEEKAQREYNEMLRKREQATGRAEDNGVEVRIKDVARFRGVRSNQLYGYGLVIGLDGSGDSRKTPFTMTLLQNALKDFG